MIIVILVLLQDMPCTIKAQAVPNSDGSFTILLNSRLNYEQQKISYFHEIEHILNGDFDYDKYLNVDELESLRHCD